MSGWIPPKPTQKDELTIYADCAGCRICKSLLIKKSEVEFLVAASEGAMVELADVPSTPMIERTLDHLEAALAQFPEYRSVTIRIKRKEN